MIHKQQSITSSSGSSSSSPSIIFPPIGNCSNTYDVKFNTYNNPSRLILFQGDGLTQNPNFGCECITNKSCNILSTLPNNIQKIIDSDCILTNGKNFIFRVNLPQSKPHKYLVIPNCKDENSANPLWNFNTNPICIFNSSSSSSLFTGSCSNIYDVKFNTYNNPSRLILFQGDGLTQNPNFGCDCITNKNCNILSSLPTNIQKIIDSDCILTNNQTFISRITLPNTIPHKYLVIPNCLDQNPSNPVWNLNTESVCIANSSSSSFSSNNCSNIYDLEFNTYNNPSRLIIFKGDGLQLNPNFGCDCITNQNCSALQAFQNNTPPNNIEKILDSSCILTSANSFKSKIVIEENTPHKYLVIPNCQNQNPSNPVWNIKTTPFCVPNNCNSKYTVKFWTYTAPSRLIILLGDGLRTDPNFGCECITNKNCSILNNLPPNIQKILDTRSIDPNISPYSNSVLLPPSIPHKVLVIPDSNSINSNATWKVEFLDSCGNCTEIYRIEFWAYTAPSRLVVLVGPGLIDNPNFGCDCITNKNCSILNNLPSNIQKIYDTSCVLANNSPVISNVSLPKNLPHKLLVIPDCNNVNPNATWKINILDSCASNCNDLYRINFWAFRAPSRLVVLIGGGLTDNPNFGCECVTNKSCSVLNNLPSNIQKIYDTSCVLADGSPISSTVRLPKNQPHKLLVIPDCNSQDPLATWKVEIQDICQPSDCTEIYLLDFWAWDSESRFIVLIGEGLRNNPNFGCECITNKSCSVLNNLPSDIQKIYDTSCILTNNNPVTSPVRLPSNVPHKFLVIPDCNNRNPNARWQINVRPSCSDSCIPCARDISSKIGFNINFTPQQKNSSLSKFRFITSYKENEPTTPLKISITGGDRGWTRDLGLVVKQPEFENTATPGVKCLFGNVIGGVNFELPTDTYLIADENNIIVAESESWTESRANFIKYGLSYGLQEAGKIIDLDNKNHIYNMTSRSYPLNSGYYKQEVLITQFPEINTGLPVSVSYSTGWATYDVASGMNYKNVFSYAVQIVDRFTFASGYIVESGSLIFSGKDDMIKTFLKASYLPTLVTGKTGIFYNIFSFCSLVKCETPPPKECPIIPECWSGSLEGKDYLNWVSGTLQKYQDIKYTGNELNLGSTLAISEQSLDTNWEILKGHIQYNNFVSGDKFIFKLYPFDYTGLYKKLHLGNNPPYPSYEFTISYPNDWNSLESLVGKFNEKLNDPFTWPVWYPYLCLSGTPTGIFITGSLAKFWKNTGSCCLPSGDLSIFDFDNRIDFESNRSLPGLNSNLFNTGITGTGVRELNNWFYDIKLQLYSGKRYPFNIYKGYTYMIPNEIELQRWTLNGWQTIDQRGNLYSGITGADPVEVPFIFKLPFPDGLLKQQDLNKLTGIVDDERFTDTLTGRFDEIYMFDWVVQTKERLCPLRSQKFKIILTNPAGFPPFVYNGTGGIVQTPNALWCAGGANKSGLRFNIKDKRTETLLGGPYPWWLKVLCPQREGDRELERQPEKEQEPRPNEGFGILKQLRSGWNLTGDFGLEALYNTGVDGQIIKGPNGEPSGYDQYRIMLKNFSGQNIDEYKPLPIFYIGNINLFAAQKYPLSPMRGQETCLLGSNYTIDTYGFVGKVLTGEYQYTITQSMNGVFKLEGLRVTQPVLDSERAIKFNRASGTIVVDNWEGTYNKDLTPSGFACHTFGNYYFYNKYTKEITFDKTLCKFSTGGAVDIEGFYDVIKGSVINRELLIGGSFNRPIEFIIISGTGLFTGLINDVTYKAYNVLGYYPLTGIVSGVTRSGKLNIKEMITGFAPDVNELYPYHPNPTGFVTATGWITTGFGISNFDYVTINNGTFVYQQDTDIYSGPQYFINIDQLLSGINSNSGDTLCTGRLENNIIYLSSVANGSRGNVTFTISNSSGFITNGSRLTGGKDIYPKIYKYFYAGTPDNIVTLPLVPVVTGNISEDILATGFYYSNSGSGSITGNISTFTGVRSFTGVWDIATGNLNSRYISFLTSGLISGNSYISSRQYGTAPGNINSRIFYTNMHNTYTFEESDTVDFIIKDLNSPTGERNGIIFRLTGVK